MRAVHAAAAACRLDVITHSLERTRSSRPRRSTPSSSGSRTRTLAMETTSSAAAANSKFSHYDEYGFRRGDDFDAKAHEAFLSSYLPVLVRRERRWAELMSHAHDGNLKKSAKLKRFVRKGVPNAYRAKVWMSVSGASALRASNRDLYHRMLSVRVDANSVVLGQIEADLKRTYPNNVYFSKEDPKSMLQPLFNVLLAFANSNPHIGYCQGLNYVAAMLLIVTHDEESSFWLLKVLTEKLLPEYYGPNIPGLITDVRVFSELLRTKSPSVYRLVEALHVPWALLCSKWFVCLFADVLPVETVLRVWDCLFYEGSKIVMRVAIALVRSNEDAITQTCEFAKLVEAFQKCASNQKAVECHEFISRMFTLSSPLSTRHLSSLRHDVGAVVSQENALRENNAKSDRK